LILSLDRFKYLATPAFVITLVTSLLAIPVAIYYGYRLLTLKRQMKEVAPSHSALFASKNVFSFSNVWVWILIACVIVYALLVFLPY
jgi:ribose/xylose/arabinose/galactoside ABC-type transport system permease subunit